MSKACGGRGRPWLDGIRNAVDLIYGFSNGLNIMGEKGGINRFLVKCLSGCWQI